MILVPAHKTRRISRPKSIFSFSYSYNSAFEIYIFAHFNYAAMKNRKKKKNEIDRRVSEHKASFLITTGVCVCVCVYHYTDERALIGGHIEHEPD